MRVGGWHRGGGSVAGRGGRLSGSVRVAIGKRSCNHAPRSPEQVAVPRALQDSHILIIEGRGCRHWFLAQHSLEDRVYTSIDLNGQFFVIMKATLIHAWFYPGSSAWLPRDGACFVEILADLEGSDWPHLLGALGQSDDAWGQRLREACFWDSEAKMWIGRLQERAAQIAASGEFRIAGVVLGASKRTPFRVPGGAVILPTSEVASHELAEFVRSYGHPDGWDRYEDDD